MARPSCASRRPAGEPEILYKNTLGIETYTLYDGQLYILEMSSKPENYKTGATASAAWKTGRQSRSAGA